MRYLRYPCAGELGLAKIRGEDTFLVCKLYIVATLKRTTVDKTDSLFSVYLWPYGIKLYYIYFNMVESVSSIER